MSYQYTEIAKVAKTLNERAVTLDNKADILKAVELRALYDELKTLPPEQRASFGKEVNQLRVELQKLVNQQSEARESLAPIDITAPFGINQSLPSLLPSENGSIHPLTREIARLSSIFERMGFAVESSREIDDQYHMFDSLNFPKGHPARDEYDTFITVETDKDGEPLIAPAHTSTMQNRAMVKYRANLEKGEPIAAVVPDRCFRNEDIDARHDHLFHQVEGVYVSKGVHAGMLVATLREFLQSYYGKELEVRMNPFYFPFTEPSFEMALSCPFCEGKDSSCKVCSGEGWIELLGCGMIHPNVLKAADIDPNIYTGFAFGCGIDRLVMMKYGIEDIRHFESAKLNFLRQF